VGCQARVLLKRRVVQARELLKKWVVRPVSISLQVRELLGIFSQGAKLQLQGSETSCPACC
jgi:hypothetical protein